MKMLSQINNRVNRVGLIFAILFSVGIIIMALPFGAALQTKDYVQLSIALIYPIGLFIGLKWKIPGVLVCLAGLVAFIIAYKVDSTVSFTFSSQIIIFWIILMLIQMIPVVLYILAYFRKPSLN